MPRRKIYPGKETPHQLLPANTRSQKITAYKNAPRQTELHRLIEANASIEMLQHAIENRPNDINIQDPQHYNMTPLCALLYQFFVETKLAENARMADSLTPEETMAAVGSYLKETYDGPLDDLTLMARLQYLNENVDENEHNDDKRESDDDKQESKKTLAPAISQNTSSSSSSKIKAPTTEASILTKLNLLYKNSTDLDLNSPSDKGTPFELAVYSGNIEVLNWLRVRGANYDLSTGILYAAIKTLTPPTISDTIQYFLEHDLLKMTILNYQYPNFENRTLVHAAIEYGHLPMLIYLVEKGADIGIQDNLGKTPLKLAQDKAQPWAVNYLQQVSDIQTDNKIHREKKRELIKNLGKQLKCSDSTEARYASAGQRSDIFDAIEIMTGGLRPGSLADLLEMADEKEKRTAVSRTMIEKRLDALRQNPIKTLKEIIRDNDVDTMINTAEGLSSPPPHIFLGYLTSKTPLASSFSKAGGPIHSTETLLEFALQKSEPIFRYFLQYAQKNKLKLDLLTDAIEAGNYEQLKSLVEMGKKEPLSEVSIDAPSNKHLLMTATTIIVGAPKNKPLLRRKHLQILSYLLKELKLDPNIVSEDIPLNLDTKIKNVTPLHSAVIHADVEIVKLLIEQGADAGQCCTKDGDNTHMSALHLALSTKAFEHQLSPIVKFLIETCGIDVNSGQKTASSCTNNAVQINNTTPLDYAIRNKYWGIAQYLYQKGARCNKENIALLYKQCPGLGKTNTISEEEIKAKQVNERTRQQVFNYLQKHLGNFLSPEHLDKYTFDGEKFKLEFRNRAAAEEFQKVMSLYFSTGELTATQIILDNTTIRFSISKLLFKIEKERNTKKRPPAKTIPFKDKYQTILQKLDLLQSLFAHYGIDCSFEARLSQPDSYEFKLTPPPAFTHNMRINFNHAALDKFRLDQSKRSKSSKTTDWVLCIKKATLENINPELIADMKKVDLHKRPILEAPPISYPSQPDETAYKTVETAEREARRQAAAALKDLPVGYIEEDHPPTETGALSINEIQAPENPALQEEKALALGQSAKSAEKERDPSLDFSWVSLEADPEDKRTGGTAIQKESEDIRPKQQHQTNRPKKQKDSNRPQKMTLATFHQMFPAPAPAKNEKSESEPAKSDSSAAKPTITLLQKPQQATSPAEKPAIALPPKTQLTTSPAEKPAIVSPSKPQQTITTANTAFFPPSSAAAKRNIGPGHNNRQPTHPPSSPVKPK